MNQRILYSLIRAKFLVVALLGMFASADTVLAAEFPSDIWQRIPVYHQGRVKPMDGYARQVVQKITRFDKFKPKFNLVDYYTEDELKTKEMKAALEIFPEGKERKFTPDQLILEWTIRPKAWERVPFIYLAREDARRELGLPINSPNSVKLNFVSPYEISTSVKLREYILGMEKRGVFSGASEESEEEVLDEIIYRELLFRYSVYREISLDPKDPVVVTSPIPSPGSRNRLAMQLKVFLDKLGFPGEQDSLYSQLQTMQSFGEGHDLSIRATNLIGLGSQGGSTRAIQQLGAAIIMPTKEVLDFELEEGDDADGSAAWDAVPPMPEDPPYSEDVEEAILEIRSDLAAMEQILEEQRDDVNNSTTLSAKQYQSVKPIFQTMLVRIRELEHVANEIHLAIYENPQTGAMTASTSMDRAGNHLQIVPSLNPYALSESRDPEDLSQPWLGMSTLLHGSDGVLKAYPSGLVDKVRNNWNQVKSAYLKDQEEELRGAMQRLADNLQKLGENNNETRTKILVDTLGDEEKDSSILSYTAYPPANSYRIDTEVRYNTMDPFMYAWIFTFVATLGFCLAFAKMRKLMFWVGAAFLIFGILWSTYGFYMRVVVTGWAPVTNMYETVIFVPWVVCSLGLVFLLMPLIDQGFMAAWRATALPFLWEAKELNVTQKKMFSPEVWFGFNIASVAIRAMLTWYMFGFMLLTPIYDGNLPLIYFGNFAKYALLEGVFITGIKVLMLILTVWFIPRLIPTAILAPFFCIYDWYLDEKLGKRFEKTYQRNYYGLAAAVCGTFLLCVASIAPIVDTGSSRVLNAGFSPLQPILRSNVWLTVHVLTIVASYGAGILAWGLGWLALGHYMFGKYRAPVAATSQNQGLTPAKTNRKQMGYRPPEQCFVLGQQCYRAIQVAVLLLATGTILGGVWADVSWGRFWGWDPKEVWALVTLLIYVAILHARFAGWFNNFGLVVGTVIGFSAIVGSWYGVNFLLPLFQGGEAVGLHSYGSGGKGSEFFVMGFVGANWVALGLVALRFQLTKLVVVDENELEEVVVDAEVSEEKQPGNLATQ